MIDLTPVVVAVVGGMFSVVSLLIGNWINSRFKDKQSADVLNAAVTNALGAAQQAAEALIRGEHVVVPVPFAGLSTPLGKAVSPAMAIGVQYVLDHAGAEAARFSISPEAIADKLSARVGLVSIQHTGAATVATALQPPKDHP